MGLKAIERAIPASMRYAWNPDHKPVFFTTALDQRLELPFELCYQWKVYFKPRPGLCMGWALKHELLLQTFRSIVGMIFAGCPANEWVKNGLYEIVDENNPETVLGSKNWENVIEPNMIISMSMLLRKKKGRGPEGASCPSCGEIYRRNAKSTELERVRW